MWVLEQILVWTQRRKGRIDECEDEWVKERFRGEWDKYRL